MCTVYPQMFFFVSNVEFTTSMSIEMHKASDLQPQDLWKVLFLDIISALSLFTLAGASSAIWNMSIRSASCADRSEVLGRFRGAWAVFAAGNGSPRRSESIWNLYARVTHEFSQIGIPRELLLNLCEYYLSLASFTLTCHALSPLKRNENAWRRWGSCLLCSSSSGIWNSRWVSKKAELLKNYYNDYSLSSG